MTLLVPLSAIRDNPYQSRREYGEIAELAERIHAAKHEFPETLGLLQPPQGRVVNPDDPSEFFPLENVIDEINEPHFWDTFCIQLAFGHRRKRAFEHLAKQDHQYFLMPVTIRDLSDDAMIDSVFTENASRKDITAVEEAWLIDAKMNMPLSNGKKRTQAQLAKEWGISRSMLANKLRLLELPDNILNANINEQLSERQCLSLIPIVRIGQMANGTEWGKAIGNTYWEPPAGPNTVVEKIINKPDSMTSEELRNHTKSMLKHAGIQIPGCIATHYYNRLPEVVQAKCKGCNHRMDQYCLQTACAKAKLDAWPNIIMQTFNEETGIPVSDRDADFDHNYEDRLRITELFLSNNYDNMVCGWRIGTAARTYERNSSYVDKVSCYESDGRAGIALGYRGSVPKTQDDDAPVYDMPHADTLASWQDEKAQIEKDVPKTARQAVADALSYHIPDFDVLQALLMPPDKDWIDEPEKVAAQLATFMINKGQGVPSWHDTTLDMVEAYDAMLKRAGIQVMLLGEEAERLRKIAVLILARWYNRHNTWTWDTCAEELIPQIVQWQEHPATADLPIAADIERALNHIEQKLENEGDEE
ncbi:MAG: hypothetical protein KC421_17740 [Anaerolineales bacterium]|nr:hypothetical protein [Anaerolineales bacterium]